MNIKQYIEEFGNEIENQKNESPFGGHFDKIILEYVSDIENGFFVECGANICQNTETLYKCGWKGMLIEPSISSFNWCLENRPDCINENCALVSFDYTGETISCSQTSIIGKSVHVFGFPIMQMDKLYEISCTTFSNLTKKHNVRKVDVFFLDTEGFELEVLKGIDFDTCYIKYFIIEINPNYYSENELMSFMLNKNFELIKVMQTNRDLLFMNKN